MADFSNFDAAIADLQKEVGEIVDLLTSDASDQAKVNEATVKLTAMRDALNVHTPDPTPTPEG